MRVRLWGARGSHAGPGVDTVRYGGHTSCIEVRGDDGTILVLDAGTGAKPLGGELAREPGRVDVLLTHLHMDHIQGLGFFAPMFAPGREVHIWGPATPSASVRAQLQRYLSPPLFPVRLREFACALTVHDLPAGRPFRVGGFEIYAEQVIHPGAAVGYRISEGGRAMAFIPDHEPALGSRDFPEAPRWLSGYTVCRAADLLIHDAQYTDEEYAERIGWGHSTFDQALAFAAVAGVREFVSFHHDPSHSDAMLDAVADEIWTRDLPFTFTPGREGATFEV